MFENPSSNTCTLLMKTKYDKFKFLIQTGIQILCGISRYFNKLLFFADTKSYQFLFHNKCSPQDFCMYNDYGPIT